MNSQIQDKIVEGLQHLDSFQVVEVLDFVEFLGHKDKTRKKDIGQVDLLFGKYKDKLTPSDLFAQLKSDTAIILS